LDAYSLECNSVINEDKKPNGENCNTSWDMKILTIYDLKSQRGFIYPPFISMKSSCEYIRIYVANFRSPLDLSVKRRWELTRVATLARILPPTLINFLLLQILIRVDEFILQSTLVNSHATLVLPCLWNKSWQNCHGNSCF
jgi:hypothetical protein